MNLRTESSLSLRRNVELHRLTTMHVGGPARFYAEPRDLDELKDLLEWSKQEKIPHQILGKGSNMIFSDGGYSGVIISMLRFEQERFENHPEDQTVSASSAFPLYRFCLLCKDHGLGGAEFLASIPGSIGGALAMNAGFSRFPGQQNQISDLVQSVEILSPSGDRLTVERSQIQFAYRHSSLTGQIILGATFRLWKRSKESIDHEIQANFDYRSRIQNVRYPSSGSIFKNPSKEMSAGKLLDSLGLKGLRVGDAMISHEHANYMINLGNASSQNFTELIEKAKKAVLNATGISLETEVILA